MSTVPTPACLYIVATPIGNLDDMTPRAINTLKQVAIIACEDTRTSGRLLAHFNITTVNTNNNANANAEDDHKAHPKDNDAKSVQKLRGHHKLWAYHEHNSAVQTPKIIEMIQNGHAVALISDAGTPLILSLIHI